MVLNDEFVTCLCFSLYFYISTNVIKSQYSVRNTLQLRLAAQNDLVSIQPTLNGTAIKELPLCMDNFDFAALSNPSFKRSEYVVLAHLIWFTVRDIVANRLQHVIVDNVLGDIFYKRLGYNVRTFVDANQ